MRWIGETKRSNDRWLPVFGRYLDQLADRVRGFGGDPNDIPPSPTSLLPPPSVGDKDTIRRTGKIASVFYDRFGDFDAFTLETERGRNLTVRSREPAVERIVERAWRAHPRSSHADRRRTSPSGADRPARTALVLTRQRRSPHFERVKDSPEICRPESGPMRTF
jgi:hypothetical protein